MKKGASGALCLFSGLQQSGARVVAGLGTELLEIVAEKSDEFCRLRVVGVGVGPALAGVEEAGVDAVDLGWDGEAEEWVEARRGMVESAIERGGEEAAG